MVGRFVSFYLCFFVFIFLSPNLLLCQNETFNWYFGDKAAISFNTPDGNPKIISDSRLSTLEGCSSISDTAGKILFYTDGVRIWNWKNEIMNPDTLLDGHYSSTQSALIIRKPLSYSIYYIFTTDAGEYIENIDPTKYNNRGLRYSVVDMRLNNGLGGLTEINKLLLQPTTEKLSAVFHNNGSDVWIVGHEWGSSNTYSYLLTDKGIVKKVKSESAIIHSGDMYRYIGHLKLSPQGNKAASVVQGFNFIELSDFNNITGKLSNSILINTGKNYSNYGLEFSPNGNFIYISEYKTNTVTQFDISQNDTSFINASGKQIFQDTSSHAIGALQIAPNGKIYLTCNESQYLAVINNPDSPGVSCHFERNGLNLGNEVKSRLGLPNLNQGLYLFKAKIKSPPACQNDVLFLNAFVESDFDETYYEWNGPNGFYSNNKNIFFTNADSAYNGKYFLAVKYKEYFSLDSMNVKIKNAPKVKILGDTLICVNNSAVLESSVKADSLIFVWSTGEIKPEIRIFSPGTYTLQTIYPNGCSTFDTIKVKGLLTNAGFTNINAGKFGNIPIDKPYTLNFNFRNNDNESLIINSVYMENSSEECKIEYNIGSNKTLEENSGCQIQVKLFSKKPVSVNDSLVLEVISPYCTLYFKIAVCGNIIVPVYSSIPALEAEPGKLFEIPLYTKIMTPTDTSFNMPFTATIALPADYFIPESCNNAEITSNKIINGKRFLTVKGETSLLNTNEVELTRLSGISLVGHETPAAIEIVEVEWSDSLFITEYIPGEIKILNCTIAIRPIELFKPTEMTIFPNPVINDKFKVTVRSEEEGNFELSLVNSTGDNIILGSWLRAESMPSLVILEYSLKEINSGAYFLRLKSPWYIKTEKVRIVK